MDRIQVQKDDHDSFIDLAHIANTRVPFESPPSPLQFQPDPPRPDTPPQPLSPGPMSPSIGPMSHPPYMDDDSFHMPPAPTMASYRSPEEIRREKSMLLYEIETKNKDNKYSNASLTMDDSVEDLRNELEIITSRRSMESSVGFWKRALLLSSEALVMGNNYWDPFGVDMSEWSRQIYFDVTASGTYEEVLEELALKYKSSIRSPPEIRLLFLLLSSFGTAVVVKKQENGLYKQLGLRQQEVRQQQATQPAPPPQQFPTQSKAPVPPPLPSHLLEKLGKTAEQPAQVSTNLSPQQMREMVKSMEFESSRSSSPAPSELSVHSKSSTSSTQSASSSASETLHQTQITQPPTDSKPARGRGRGRGRAKNMVSL